MLDPSNEATSTDWVTLNQSYDYGSEQCLQKLSRLKHSLVTVAPLEIFGKVASAVGTTIHSNITKLKIGDICNIVNPHEVNELRAEVIAIKDQHAVLLPFGNISGISNDTIVKQSKTSFEIKVGDFLLGKVIDGLGNVFGLINPQQAPEHPESSTEYDYYPVINPVPDPLTRPIINDQFITGVKSIDLFMTCGIGQRLAIFAAAGMGKTTLMGMILRNSHADVVVVCLLGERGREIQEFISLEISDELRQKCVLVVSTSDRSSVEQSKSGYVAHTIAEYFRDQGKKVLLFVDSITRFARALREIGLSAGEAPSRGGYPPSVFLSFPKLMERAGCSAKGSITAFYTVLMEGNDIRDDPIADEIKSIVDGHIILDRALVEKSHFPAINILKSLSRIADRLISKEHVAAARKLRGLLAKYNDLEFLLQVGEYKAGNDLVADEAVRKYKDILQLLVQRTTDNINFTTAVAELERVATQ